MVRKSSMELTTALRIIERSDEDCLAKQKQTGFLPPGRPKWREVCMDKLGQSVNQKMEGNLLEGGEENKMWLVRHFEVIRMLMLEDLMIAKHHLVTIFPPKYNIAQHCISLYHRVVATRPQIIIEEGLEGQEYVSMFQWVLNTYPGPELMGSTALGLEKNLFPPC
jgi:exocyst complex component 3